jgi:predicted phosphoadenosine phosphosulfate sulfurtransferase
MKIRKKKYIEQNVYEKSLERIRHLYDCYDELVVSFSGGKDSTALLNVVIEVARELGKLPVRAVFYDEEVIHPPTIEYVHRVRENPDVDLEWYCLQVQHRNACSNDEPFWFCWDETKQDLWVRDKPDFAISEHPKFERGMTMQDFGQAQFRKSNTVVVQGIRTEESIRRFRIVAFKEKENYICRSNGANFSYPIYDWSSKDVWKLVELKNLDYNRTYDHFNRTEIHNNFLRQRVCPPFGEEPLRGLWIYAECWPELWHKMINRVPGVATAWRYSNTELYSSGYKPDQTNWREHIENILSSYKGEYRRQAAQAINDCIRSHKKRSDDPIPDDQGHPMTGISWKFLGKVASRGDFKGRIRNQMENGAVATRNKMGITHEEAIARYGKPTE